jgi:hypothetical protein
MITFPNFIKQESIFTTEEKTGNKSATYRKFENKI